MPRIFEPEPPLDEAPSYDEDSHSSFTASRISFPSPPPTPVARNRRARFVAPNPNLTGRCNIPDLNVAVVEAGSSRYLQEAHKAYRFFRGNASGRYSDRTMNTLAALPMEYEEGGRARQTHRDFPYLLVSELPFTYNEETEVKVGGLMGMAVCWSNGKTLLAVQESVRRQKVGAMLYTHVLSYVPQPFLWVGKQNVDGQIFCLSLGMWITSMTASGALRFSASELMEED